MPNNQPALTAESAAQLKAGITQIMAQYQADPSTAVAEFRARTRTISNFETETSSRGFTQVIDEPEALGGTNKGPNPVEVLLGALGTCQEIVIVAYAAALGIELDAVSIDVRGEIDLRGLFAVADVPSGFAGISFDANIQARHATPEQLQQLKTLALAHCPVLDTLQRAIPVENTYTLGVSADHGQGASA